MLHIINKALFALLVKLLKYVTSPQNDVKVTTSPAVCVVVIVYLEQQEADQVTGVGGFFALERDIKELVNSCFIKKSGFISWIDLKSSRVVCSCAVGKL